MGEVVLFMYILKTKINLNNHLKIKTIKRKLKILKERNIKKKKIIFLNIKFKE